MSNYTTNIIKEELPPSPNPSPLSGYFHHMLVENSAHEHVGVCGTERGSGAAARRHQPPTPPPPDRAVTIFKAAPGRVDLEEDDSKRGQGRNHWRAEGRGCSTGRLLL